MLTIEKVDTDNKSQVRRFVRIPYRLYANHPKWVPPLLINSEMMLNRQKHPFYEHSDADFFIAVRDGRDVGRIAATENRPYNQYHGTHQAQFYCFDCEEDQEATEDLLTGYLSGHVHAVSTLWWVQKDLVHLTVMKS